jgi:hypothetical protein
MATTNENLVAASWADRSQSLLENTNQLLLNFLLSNLIIVIFMTIHPF